MSIDRLIRIFAASSICCRVNIFFDITLARKELSSPTPSPNLPFDSPEGIKMQRTVTVGKQF